MREAAKDIQKYVSASVKDRRLIAEQINAIEHGQ
jgi:hypothetical protein